MSMGPNYTSQERQEQLKQQREKRLATRARQKEQFGQIRMIIPSLFFGFAGLVFTIAAPDLGLIVGVLFIAIALGAYFAT